jgi:hypothetical protein
VLGMILEERNEIFNFIGCLEINDTDTGNWFQVRELRGEIPEYDVNETKVQEIVQY